GYYYTWLETFMAIRCCSPEVFVCLFVCFVRQGFSLQPGSLGTSSVDQADLKLTDPPASDFQILGLKVCPSTASPSQAFFFFFGFSRQARAIQRNPVS
ncbi:zinc finger protein 592, isoform CRA_a, partial [Mus musculus]